jgi:predicted  nucleic acid-binding Zn-ribbon protein
MADKEPKLAHLEAESLETHVAVCYERYHHFNKSLQDINAKIDKNEKDMDKGFSDIKKMLMWTASTLFSTMLIAIFAQMFNIL